MPIKKRLEILSLGDEFLLGLRDNAHLSYIGRELARKGLSIARDQELRDNVEEIRHHFLETWGRADIVITVGGLGPTADDLTRVAISDALGLRLIPNASVEASIRMCLAKVGRVPNQAQLSQSLVPEGAEILPNPLGTAPGIWLEKDGRILVMLPGAANEMRPMFIEQVLPRLEARDIALINDAFLQLRTCGITESEASLLLAPVFSPLKSRINVGFGCSATGLVDVRIGAGDDGVGWEDIEKVGNTCRELLGSNFLGYGDVTLAEIIIRHLRAQEMTVAVAESCTGGLLSSAFTDIPGASKVFRGGVVCYNNDIKMDLLDVPESILLQHGAVSAEAAAAMATGAQERLDSDFAISVTGYAGPEGGGVSSPVGTIYLGFASPQGVWSRKVFLDGTRMNIRERSVVMALDWIRRKLKQFGADAEIAHTVSQAD
ncbi:MAG TPA: CinA family nicotinamide mononucleotide deamidase-related protein [Opitutales bacterium]|nr:CinA family nicotinamide mononucleotide deamidase-related protein [Opitutales bacterium]